MGDGEERGRDAAPADRNPSPAERLFFRNPAFIGWLHQAHSCGSSRVWLALRALLELKWHPVKVYAPKQQGVTFGTNPYYSVARSSLFRSGHIKPASTLHPTFEAIRAAFQAGFTAFNLLSSLGSDTGPATTPRQAAWRHGVCATAAPGWR